MCNYLCVTWVYGVILMHTAQGLVILQGSIHPFNDVIWIRLPTIREIEVPIKNLSRTQSLEEPSTVLWPKFVKADLTHRFMESKEIPKSNPFGARP